MILLTTSGVDAAAAKESTPFENTTRFVRASLRNLSYHLPFRGAASSRLDVLFIHCPFHAAGLCDLKKAEG